MKERESVRTIISLLELTSPTGKLSRACQQALEACKRGEWGEALKWAEQDCGAIDGLVDANAPAQALVVKGIIRQELNDLDQALACYQEACQVFRCRGNHQGETVMHVILGNLASLRQQPLADVQAEYQRADDRFRNLCACRPVGWGYTTLRSWCEKMERVLNECWETARWIPFMEVSSAGPPWRYVSQIWEQIELMATGDILIGGKTYQPQPVGGIVPHLPPLRATGKYFITQARGNSMVDAGIHDGDLVLVHGQPDAEHWQIVVVERGCEGGTESLVKRFCRDNQGCYLKSANPEYKEIYEFRKDPSLCVRGIVLAVLKPV